MEIVNIDLEERIDYTLSITYRDETTGLPIDLTGYSAIVEVRPSFGDSTIILTLTDTNGKIILGGITGAIDLVFLANDTSLAQDYSGWVRAAYDLVLIDPLGSRKKILKGFVTLARSSTID